MKTRKPNGISKKALALLLTLAVALLGLPLTGCGRRADGPLRVLVDWDTSFDGDVANLQWAVETLKKDIEIHGGPTDIEFEYLPSPYGEGSKERPAALSRLRTEIMAGQGPDVYLMQTAGDNSLFKYPEKNLELGMFYPLDDLLPTAQFMEFDKMIPQIMEVGVSEKWGRGLLPTDYIFPVCVYEKKDVSFDASVSHTWADMLADDTGVLAASTILFGTNADGKSLGSPNLEYTLGDLADFSEGTLNFTEEDLRERLYEVFRAEERYQNGELPAAPEHLEAGMFDSIWTPFPFLQRNYLSAYPDGIDPEGAYSFVPVYADEGGITAYCGGFCAIDAKTKRPEDAFFVLDMYMSRKYRRMNDFRVGAPVYADYGSEAMPSYTGFGAQKPLAQESFEAYTALFDQITSVQIRSGLDGTLGAMEGEAEYIYFGLADGTEEDIDRLISDAYRTMRQAMDE